MVTLGARMTKQKLITLKKTTEEEDKPDDQIIDDPPSRKKIIIDIQNKKSIENFCLVPF